MTDNDRNATVCQTCGGEGVVNSKNHLGVDEDVECPDCGGTGDA